MCAIQQIDKLSPSTAHLGSWGKDTESAAKINTCSAQAASAEVYEVRAMRREAFRSQIVLHGSQTGGAAAKAMPRALTSKARELRR